MTLPKMILFDYGQTLIGALEWDPLRDRLELMPYLTRNPRGLSAREIEAFSAELFGQLCGPVRAMDREIHAIQFLRTVNTLLGLEYSIPEAEQEHIGEGLTVAPMPWVGELLALLRELGIRTGVVSNIEFSERELRRRISKKLPGHEFEFVIASSEYGVRKPDPLIFRLALAKAGLEPGEVWFCGDNPRCDVGGSHAAGMTSVWYEELTMEDPWRDAAFAAPQCPHVHIHDWRELIEILKDTK